MECMVCRRCSSVSAVADLRTAGDDAVHHQQPRGPRDSQLLGDRLANSRVRHALAVL